MPEGPNIFILTELAMQFKRKKVLSVSGNSKIDINRLKNKVVKDIKCWGKHFLICFNNFTVRIHLLLFGSYRINSEKSTPSRLSLTFTNGTLNLYGCSVKFIEGDINKEYDWSGDIMNSTWDPQKAMTKLQKKKNWLLCDALLDQNIFSGVGNIIKNEVLFNTRTHPMSKVGKVPKEKMEEIIEESKTFTFNFLLWQRTYEVMRHVKIYNKGMCLMSHKTKREDLGRFKRRNTHCDECQILYS